MTETLHPPRGIRTFDGVDLTDPLAAARERPVFELRSAT
jgi:hypothetical protein